MEAVNEHRERDIMVALLTELNEKFNTGLDLNFSTSREAQLEMEEGDIAPPLENVILVGSSYLARVAAAMRQLGEDLANNMASPYWRLTEDNVAASAAALSEAARNNPAVTIIFQLYYSSIFFVSGAPGEQALPRKG